MTETSFGMTDFHRLADNLPDNIARWDVQGRNTYCNPSMRATFGMALDELLGLTPSQQFPDGRFLPIENALRTVLATGFPHIFDPTPISTPQGLRVHVISLLPEKNSEGQITGVLGIGRDITKEHQLHADLTQRENELRMLADATPGVMGVYVLRPNGTIYMPYASAKFEAVYGLKAEDLREDAHAIHDMVHPDDVAMVNATIAKSAQNMSTWEVQYRINHPVRGVRWLETCTHPVAWPDGCIAWYGHVQDITERKQTANWTEVLTKALQFTNESVFLTNEKLQFVWVNEAACKNLGYSHDELLTMGPYDIDPTAKAHAQNQAVSLVLAATENMQSSSFTHHQRRDGSLIPVDLSSVQFSVDGNSYSLTTARDASQRLALEEVRAAQEQEFRTLVENAPEAVVRYDADLRRIYINPAWERMSGASRQDYLGKLVTETDAQQPAPVQLVREKLKQVWHDKNPVRFHYTWTNYAGKTLHLHMTATPELDVHGAVKSILTVIRDVTEVHEQNERIAHMAFYDTLTDLPNRSLFQERLQQLQNDAHRHQRSFGVLFMDLDRFKDVNDTRGHHIGDTLLQAVGQRLRAAVRGNDLVARLGGDEFGFLISDVRTPEDLAWVGNKLVECFSSPFSLAGEEVHMGVSIGISCYPHDSEDVHELMRLADTAMYAAKRVGKSHYCFYESELSRMATERVLLGADLRHAVQRGELEVYYQPKVRTQDHSVVGAEALVRWKHPQRGYISPVEFIPLAEDQGLIGEIGSWVLENACIAACRWAQQYPAFEKININVSVHQVAETECLAHMVDIIRRTQCPLSMIELEITESALLDNETHVQTVLQGLRAHGISIAIDDFGTGYSALSYLTKFPIDVLKIDRSFIDPIDKLGNDKALEVVKAIVAMAHCLQLRVVAEGVETPTHAQLLRDMGCDISQGYLHGRPQNQKAFSDYLQQTTGP